MTTIFDDLCGTEAKNEHVPYEVLCERVAELEQKLDVLAAALERLTKANLPFPTNPKILGAGPFDKSVSWRETAKDYESPWSASRDYTRDRMAHDPDTVGRSEAMGLMDLATAASRIGRGIAGAVARNPYEYDALNDRYVKKPGD